MNSSIRKLIAYANGVAISIFGMPSALAQGGNDGFFNNPQAGAVPNVVAQGTLGGNVTALINYFLGFLGMVAVAFLIYGGVLMVTSAGEEEGVTKAKKIITWAAVGIVIIMLSYTIVTFVTSALG